MWSDEYRPESLSDIIGNDDSISKVIEWAQNWNTESEAMVLYGPPGVGKTSCAHQIASRLNWDIIEMNASQQRTRSDVEDIAGASSMTATLTGSKRRLIVVDEADNMHGNVDRGGESAIRDIIKDANQPIIMIANDYYELSRSLRNNTESVEFKPVDSGEIASLLAQICDDRDIGYSRRDLISIANKSNGDVRGAINDLQRFEAESTPSKQRETKDEIFEFLDKILKTGDGYSSRRKARTLDQTPYELFNWIEANIFREYSPYEIEASIENLSRASQWLGRTNKTQKYRFWKYVNDNLTVGLQSARQNKHTGWTRWQTPRYTSTYDISNETARKISVTSGCSLSTARSEICPHIRKLVPYCKPRDLTVGIARQYSLDAENLSELTGSGESTNKVQSIVKDSKKS